MIDLTNANEGDIARDVYERPLQEQLGNFGNPFDEMQTLLERIANFSERQREKSPPDVVDLSPSSGSQVANSYTTKTKLRIYGILITGASGDRLRLNAGLRSWSFWSNGTPAFFYFPYTVDVGVDLSVTDVTSPASTAWSFFVFGYPE